MPRFASPRPATNNASILNSAAAQINAIFPNSQYGELNDTIACMADVFPDGFKISPRCVPNNLRNEWGDNKTANVHVFGSSANGTIDASENARYYTITYGNVPSKVCAKLAPALAANFGVARINTTEIVNSYDEDNTNDFVNENKVRATCSSLAGEVVLSVIGN